MPTLPTAPRSRITSALATVGAAAILVVGIDYISLAATGSTLLLGRGNSADAQTTVARTTAGPVLRLKAQSGSPALSVNTKKKVTNLNADQLDGLHGSALARTSSLTTFQGPACKSVADLSGPAVKVADLGTFTKGRADSSLDVDYGTNLQIDEVGGNGTIFELRVDDTPLDQVVVREGQTFTPVRFRGYALGISAGDHTVSIWAQSVFGTAAGSNTVDPFCFTNSRPFVNRVRVLETF